MKDIDIASLDNQRNKLRYKVLSKETRSTWFACKKARNEIKHKINTTKTSFYKNICGKSTFEGNNNISLIAPPQT